MPLLNFERIGKDADKSYLKPMYQVNKFDGSWRLGLSWWSLNEKKYSFYINSKNDFVMEITIDELREIADFCERKTAEHKEP